MSRKKQEKIILIDRREQLPYSFSDYIITTLPYTLQTGDYSVAIGTLKNANEYEYAAYDTEISIERKTLDDFTSVISEKSTRERFEDSVKRGSRLKYYAVFIEASEMDVMSHRYTSQILPQAVLNTAIRWSVKHRVPIVFCDNRINAEYHTYQALMGFLDYKKKEII